MTAKERNDWERKILDEVNRIGEMVREITPKDGHLSMTWFPDGHMDVFICSGERVKNADGTENTVMILDAWANMKGGIMQVHRP